MAEDAPSGTAAGSLLQAEDGIRDKLVTGVQTCALPISGEKVQVSSDGGSTWADVTSSDATTWSYTDPTTHSTSFTYQARIVDAAGNVRSEERRVGKESRSRWSPDH